MKTSSTFHDEKILLILIMSCFDAIATMLEIELGIAVEANPFMDWLINDIGMVQFSATKVILTALSCYILFAFRDRMLSIVSVNLILFVYSLIMIYHAAGIYLSLP